MNNDNWLYGLSRAQILAMRRAFIEVTGQCPEIIEPDAIPIVLRSRVKDQIRVELFESYLNSVARTR